MYSIHVFAQHKLLYDTLTSMTPDEQAAIDRAFQGSHWIKDVNGNLLSPLSPLLMPRPEQTHLAIDVDFSWPDSGTRARMESAAQPQLIACEVHGISDRNDLAIHIHGVIGGEQGEPLEMYEAVPRGAVQEAQKQMHAAIGRTGAQLPAYRIVHVGESIRALELQRVVRRRDRRMTKVKSVDVYEIRLERFGTQARVIVDRRATMRETGSAAPPQTLLAGGNTRGLVLHALTGGAAQPYGVMEGQDMRVPSNEALAWLQKLTVRPDPPPLPVPRKPRPVPATPLPEPQPEQEVVLPAESPPSPAVELEPEMPAEVTPEVDPWLTLPQRMAVDPHVVHIARKTLERARPLLLTGAPGVGKTLLATLLAEALCGEENYTLVTADARWTSSEVLGGLKVVPGSTLRYEFSPGIVTRAALRHRQSVQSTGRPHALIIDEFNRAHQDEAFGRLLTLLDPRYRQQLPLVDPADGAPEPIFLPDDFLLIGTLNDADTARLHDLSAALLRRFTTLEVRIPASERTHLEKLYPDLPGGTLDTLYAVLGDGSPEDAPAGRLRGSLPLGTHFMTEVLEYVRSGMTLDTALSATLPMYFTQLTAEALTRLAKSADEGGLSGLQVLAHRAAQHAAF